MQFLREFVVDGFFVLGGDVPQFVRVSCVESLGGAVVLHVSTELCFCARVCVCARAFVRVCVCVCVCVCWELGGE